MLENPTLLVTAYALIETVVKAMKAGAVDYITKPVIPEELNIKQVAEDAGISRKNVYENLKKLEVDPSAFRKRP